MVADELDYVVGVDTHRDEHGLRSLLRRRVRLSRGRRCVRARAVIGRRFGSRAPPRVVACGRSRAPAATAPALRAISSIEAKGARGQPRAAGGARLRGKDDALDAARTARAALASETLALPRAGERREALRLLLVARRSAVDVRREALRQLRAVIVTAPERLREELRRLPAGKLLDRCSRLRRSSRRADELATRLVLRSLARRIQAATVEAAELERELLAHVRALAPALLDEPGVGPIVAAQLLVAWSHRGRLRSEACFARLAGVAPVPASSGQTTASAQPRRRPPTQPRSPHHRPPPPPPRPNNPRLHRTPPRRRQDPPRRNTPTQALPRPPPLPTTRTTSRS